MVEISIIKTEILRKLCDLWKLKNVFLLIDFLLVYSQISDVLISSNLGERGWRIKEGEGERIISSSCYNAIENVNCSIG